MEIAKSEGLLVPSKLDVSKSKIFLCNIIANAVHPFVKVTDIRSSGISKATLWEMFSINKLNAAMGKINPSNTKEANESIEQSELVNFDFGAALVGSKPSFFAIALHNSSVAPIDWSFQLLNDFELNSSGTEPENPNDDPTKQNFVLDNNIFYLSPRSGHLNPGESGRIQLSHTHEFTGPHSLSVILRLKNPRSPVGKNIQVNFTGFSIPNNQRFLHLQDNVHQFGSINVNTSNPPIQSYRLMNNGVVPLDYVIDSSAIEMVCLLKIA
jgi:hypothetical protein